MLAASAWKYTVDDDGHVYRIQIKNVDSKGTRDIIEESLSDWKPSGEGWNDSGQILFFVKKFNNVDAWEEWTKKFKSFKLDILDKNGKLQKTLKPSKSMTFPDLPVLPHGGLASGLPFIQKEDKRAKGKRVCGKCKLVGHNARTCVDFHRRNPNAMANKGKP